MLKYIRDKGVGCAETVRTTRTSSEERFAESVKAELLTSRAPLTHKKLQKERFNADLMRVKTQYTNKMEWGETRWALSLSKNDRFSFRRSNVFFEKWFRFGRRGTVRGFFFTILTLVFLCCSCRAPIVALIIVLLPMAVKAP